MTAGMGVPAGSLPHDRPLLVWQDAAAAAWLGALLPLAWLVPPRLWEPCCLVAGRAMGRLAPGGTAVRAAQVRQRCGGCQALPAPLLTVARSRARRMERHLQYLRELRPGGWRPHIELIGDEHISRALRSGKGCIVWVAPMTFAFLVAKKGLSAAGYSLTHLSHTEHAVSQDTRLAHRLSALRIIPEDRYLAQRVVMTDGSELRCTRQLYERLQANALVSITAETPWGARLVTAPFLAGTMRLPSGAPSLSLATGATLLPAFVVKQGPDRFAIIVEPPLTAASSSSRHEAVDELVRRYVTRIEHHVIGHPDQYANWW